jgi:hypothetical protein
VPLYGIQEVRNVSRRFLTGNILSVSIEISACHTKIIMFKLELRLKKYVLCVGGIV